MEAADRRWPNSIPRFLWRSRGCPLCGSISFKEAEIQPLDSLLRVAGLHPVRCVNCWRRYYCFSRANVESSESDSDRS